MTLTVVLWLDNEERHLGEQLDAILANRGRRMSWWCAMTARRIGRLRF